MNRFEFYKNLDEFKGTRSETFLQHYGILGQKWGQRRWQNADGTFNTEGKIRYFGSKRAQEVSDDELKDTLSKVYNKKWNKIPNDEKEQLRNEISSIKKDFANGKSIEDIAKNSNFEEYQISDILGRDQKIGSTNYTWDRMDNIYKYDNKYQNADGTLTKKGQKLLDKGKNTEGLINMDLYNKSKYTEDDWKQAEEESQRHQNEIVSNAKAKVNTNKELSDKNINEQEFKDIVEELNDFNMRDFYKNHRDEYNDVADIGMDALNKSDDYGADCKIGDDGDREWFMWEDQTIGNPEIAYLYYKGYSKDYIKQYLSKPLPDSLAEMEDNDPYAHAFFVRDEFHRGGDAYIDALFDNDQKLGSFFNKTPEEKAEKKAAKEAKKINNELEEIFKYDQAHEDEVMDSYILESEFAPLFTDLRQSNNQKLDKEYKRTEEIFEDFEKNQVNNFATAGITNFLNDDSDNKSMTNLANYVKGYIFGDADQGFANAEALYTKYDKNIDPKEIDNLYQKLHVKKDLYDENVQYLKDNNKTLSKVKDEYLRRLVEENDEGWMNKATKSDLALNSYWDLYNAADGSRGYDNNLKNKYKEAKSISSKLSKSCGNDEMGWNLLNLALLNLGLDRTNYKDITSSDWNKINKEISELKEEYKDEYED